MKTIQPVLVAIALTVGFFSDEVSASDFHCALKMSTIRHLDIENPSIQLGFEIPINSLVTYEVSAGVLIPKSIVLYLAEAIATERFPTHQGFRLESTVKYWFGENGFSKNSAKHFYLGLNAFYIKNEYTITDWFYDSDTTLSTVRLVRNQYDIYKELGSINVMFGIQRTIGRITVTPTWGIGIIHHYVREFDRMWTTDSYKDLLHWDVNNTHWWPSFNFDVVVGVLL